MARQKQDPIVAVLAYFETASIEVAELALALAKDRVRIRQGPRPPRTRKQKKLTEITANAMHG